jgi:hypothetical protein
MYFMKGRLEMERKYFATALVLLNIANGNKGAREKAERIETYLEEFSKALIEHTLEVNDLVVRWGSIESVQDTFPIPPISG